MTLRNSLCVAVAGLSLGVGWIAPLFAQGAKTEPATITVAMGGQTFQVPRGYLMEMREAQEPIRFTGLQTLNFSFWVSDRKPPLKEPTGWFIREFWPEESGRTAKDASDFVVTIHARQRKPGLGEQWVHPAQMAETALSNAPWLGDDRQSRRFGLDCHEFTPVDYPTDALFTMCTAGGNEPQLYLVNRRPEDRDVVIILGPDREEYLKRHGTFWRLDAWFESDGLFFTALFPEEALERWRDVMEGATGLLRAWRTR
jgi:hypothetical protein